jgi:ATP-dependent protease ClpP protease subunit
MSFLLSLIVSMAWGADITLTETNHCYLNEEVNYNTMQDLKFCLADQVVKRGRKNYTIYLVLDSPGGSIYEGLKFIEYAESIPNLETITLFAASMAAEIAQALPGDRHATRNGIMMFHRAAGVFKGQFGDGELEQKLKLWKHIVAKMEQKASKRIGITHKKYKQLVKDEWWLYGQQNKSKNTVDHISSVKCNMSLQVKRVKKKMQTFLGPIEWTESACPMMN